MVSVTSGPVALAAGCGLGVAAGLWLVVSAGMPVWMRLRARRQPGGGLSAQARTVRLVGAVGAGLAVGVLTGWPVAAALAALAVLAAPSLLAESRVGTAETARVEALAGWADMLRDTLAAGAGLEQTIRATAPIAPDPIRVDVLTLAAAVQDGARLVDALGAFADRVDDPAADLIVAALRFAAAGQGRHLADLLDRLATAARGQAALRLRAAATRARIRTSTRVIVVTTMAMALGLTLFSPAFVAPYSTLTGQLVLAAVGALWAAAFVWLSRMGRITRPTRILTGAAGGSG
ncbi:Flp pilus assembly protein TadB [Frankia canadensis]|uniref:Flp pilus assembly protein TadB n=1 Tax=Frankia canadensis TaxID=1836972 RepID=A0A2I2KW46_9ACTN|nr:type II secretion system F family protein [Frankia canadensis]SNQ49880.1 Flp pilus assembly protein TadB [Frankia canadensis]SOU57170.1 Flp pilus assembly protein TadB [Frankia canadensis]